MKNIYTTIYSNFLVVMCSLHASCNSNNPVVNNNDALGVPSTYRRTYRPTPEEILATAKNQADELLVHPEKADAWLATALSILESGTLNSGITWRPAATGAAHCAHNLIKENAIDITHLSDVANIMEQAASCVINCAKAHWQFAPDGVSNVKFKIAGEDKSPEEMLDTVITGLNGPTLFPQTTSPFATDKIAQQIYNGLPRLKILFSTLVRNMKTGCEPLGPLGAGVQAIIDEAEQVLNATTCPDKSTTKDQAKFVRNLTRMSLLLVEAVKACFERGATIENAS